MDRAHPARVYAYWLGGKDHFKADRDAGDAMVEALPGLRVAARANRAFMVRVVTHLAAERGIRLFLDIGAGLPVAPNLHEVVQGIAPESRVVYVDNDPVVLAHARALLTSTSQGAVDCVHADLRDPARVIEAAGQTLDFGRPVAVTLFAVLHLVEDHAIDPIMAVLTGPLAPGSAVAVTVVTGDSDPAGAAAAQAVAGKHGLDVMLRTQGQARAMLAGLEVVEPGVVLVHRWRPNTDAPQVADRDVHVWGAVAVKPAAGVGQPEG